MKKIFTIFAITLLFGCVNEDKNKGGQIMDKCKNQSVRGISEQDIKTSTKSVDNKNLIIKWQRLIYEKKTCPRCGATEKELDKAVSTLKQSLAPLGIEVVLEKEELSVSKFKKDSLQSNRIWINSIPIENYIEGKVGKSPCCDVCGPSECRTVEMEGKIYETIPSEIIIQAGLAAASKLVSKNKGKTCCEK